ncbi:MAG TPA: hypothetical protein VE596_19300 [Gaiellaceae bacterium]|jgi:hypothetical protein|nr:hypothetical protein [Gaiellaceae bacterium]
MSERRWDGDERGYGAGDARAFVAGASELVGAMQEDAWVAEDPDTHLLPHLQRACESLPFELVEAHASSEGRLDVELRWQGQRDRVGEVREAVYHLLGSMAETATYVRQRREPTGLSFDVVTGIVEGDAAFAPHGHMLSLRVREVFAA